MKKFKEPTFIYLPIQIISFEVLMVIFIKKYNSINLKQFFIYINIAIILSVVLIIISKVFKKRSKLIDYIFVPTVIFFTIYSVWKLFF